MLEQICVCGFVCVSFFCHFFTLGNHWTQTSQVAALKVDVFNITDGLSRSLGVWLLPGVLFPLSYRHRCLPSSAAGVELGKKAVFNTSSFDYWSP